MFYCGIMREVPPKALSMKVAPVPILMFAVAMSAVVLFIFLPVETVECALQSIGSCTVRLLRLVTGLFIDARFAEHMQSVSVATIGTRN